MRTREYRSVTGEQEVNATSRQATRQTNTGQEGTKQERERVRVGEMDSER